MKRIYYADAATHVFMGSRSVPDDYKPKANESFDNPSGKVTPTKLSGRTWLDATPEEHDAYLKKMQDDYLRQHPELTQPSQPDKGDQALNLLGQQQAKSQATVATLEKKVDTLTQAVGILGQQIAQAQKPATPQA